MTSLVKIPLTFLVAALSLQCTDALCQSSTTQGGEVTILRDSSSVDAETTLHYVGEVKDRSYVKLKLEPVPNESTTSSAYAAFLQYKGTYYEAVNGRTYPVTASFNSGSRTWTIRCQNSKKQTIYLFSGRQDLDGNIDGTWKSKKHQYQFYLFKK